MSIPKIFITFFFVLTVEFIVMEIASFLYTLKNGGRLLQKDNKELNLVLHQTIDLEFLPLNRIIQNTSN